MCGDYCPSGGEGGSGGVKIYRDYSNISLRLWTEGLRPCKPRVKTEAPESLA